MRYAIAALVLGFALFGSNVHAAEEMSKHRILVLTAGAPLLVDVQISINGQPVGAGQQRRLDALFSGGDGAVSWEDAIKRRDFTGPRLAYTDPSGPSMRALMKRFDENRDEMVQREEAAKLLASYYGAAPFFVQRGGSTYSPQHRPIYTLLDLDNDENLSLGEVADAARILKGRDTDDNDVLSLSELLNQSTLAYRAASRRTTRSQECVFDISVDTSWRKLHTSLLLTYAAATTLKPEEIGAAGKRLDADHDNVISAEELEALRNLPSELSLQLKFGGDGMTFDVLDSSERLQRVVDSGQKSTPFRQLVFKTKGCKLLIVAGDVAPGNSQRQAEMMVSRFDTNKNGYLDDADNSRGLSERNLKLWDANSDGKVYVEEIATHYRELQESANENCSVMAADSGNNAFALLDRNADNKLSNREWSTAAARLKAADADNSGVIEPGETSRTIRVVIARGRMAASYLSSVSLRQRGLFNQLRIQPQRNSEPTWFEAMDRNGDGDISRREFPGDQKQFQQLDENGDGFITAAEARQ